MCVCVYGRGQPTTGEAVQQAALRETALLPERVRLAARHAGEACRRPSSCVAALAQRGGGGAPAADAAPQHVGDAVQQLRQVVDLLCALCVYYLCA